MTADAPAVTRQSRIILTLVVMVTTLAIDLWSKAWAWENLRQQKPRMIIDPLLEFSFSFNLGAAFGFLNSVSWARVFFIVVTAAALAYMAWLAWNIPTARAYGFVAIGLIAAGAAGNLHDRLVRANDGGYYGVVDFIKINYPWGGSWPTFNVADVLLLVGVGVLFVYLHREAPDEDDAGDESSAEVESGGGEAVPEADRA